MPWAEMGWMAERFMRFLRGDPNYIELCRVQKCYRARLTPKPWRDNGEPAHVCRLEQVQSLFGPDEVHPDLKEQLRLHDEVTLPENNWSNLARRSVRASPLHPCGGEMPGNLVRTVSGGR